MINSVQLARLWMTLADLKDAIDNQAVPLGSHLGIEDPELMISLEDLSAKIGTHFKKYRLVAEPNKGYKFED